MTDRVIKELLTRRNQFSLSGCVTVRLMRNDAEFIKMTANKRSAKKRQNEIDMKTTSVEIDLNERPMNRIDAAAHLGISVRYLFNLRKRLEPHFAVCEWRGGKLVFYKHHIINLRENLRWQSEEIRRKSKKKRKKMSKNLSQSRAGIRSGKTAPGASISTSKGKGSGGRRASAVRNRLKKR